MNEEEAINSIRNALKQCKKCNEIPQVNFRFDQNNNRVIRIICETCLTTIFTRDSEKFGRDIFMAWKNNHESFLQKTQMIIKIWNDHNEEVQK